MKRYRVKYKCIWHTVTWNGKSLNPFFIINGQIVTTSNCEGYFLILNEERMEKY